jgi:hypothetical protein
MKYRILIIAIIFMVNILMLFGGIAFQKLLGVKNQYFLLLFTGLEMEIFGIYLFGTVYGMENLSVIGIIDLGHELFIWFILTDLLIVEKSSPAILKRLGNPLLHPL